MNRAPGVLNFAMLFRFLVLLLCFGVGPAVFLFRRGDVPGTLVQLLEEEGVWSELLKNVCSCWFDFNKLGNHVVQFDHPLLGKRCIFWIDDATVGDPKYM